MSTSEGVPELPMTTAAKAWFGAAAAGILAFLTPIATTLHASQPITAVTWVDSVVSLLVFSGAVFGTVYQIPNRVK